MIKTYAFLVGAVLFEVCGTLLLPVTKNFTKILPTSALAIFYLTAFYLLTFVVNKLPFDCYGTLIDWETGIWDAFQPIFLKNNQLDLC